MGKAASETFSALATSSRRELEHVFRRGETPSIDAIVGHEYRGYNTVRATSLLRIRTFIKAFSTNGRGEAYGCNTPVRQNGLGSEWIARPSEARPKRFAFFAVAPVDAQSRDNVYVDAVLLDYGRGGNARFDVARLLRDYLVRVERGSDDLLLGKAYLALGPVRLPLGFFLLERHRALRPGETLEPARQLTQAAR